MAQRYFNPTRFIRKVYRHVGSWRKVGDYIGFGEPAMWRMAAKGHISRDNENRLRFALRLPPRRILRIDQMSDETIRLYMRTRC